DYSDFGGSEALTLVVAVGCSGVTLALGSGVAGGIAGTSAFSPPVTSRIERWNSLMVCPIADPISGRRLGPKISSATPRRMINSGQCKPNGIEVALFPGQSVK